jgi:tetratricopeptide (TPR) repeat protein
MYSDFVRVFSARGRSQGECGGQCLDHARFGHTADDGGGGDSKAFYLVDLEAGSGVVYFANSYNGLAIMRPMAEVAVPGDHPIFDSGILDGYPPHDSVGLRLIQAVYRGSASGATQVVRDAPATGEKPTEAVVNDLGYWLLRRDRLDEAIELFELNVTLYPEAWNVYDSLGEAQLEKGLRDEGLASCRRSLELNPDNDNARRVLAEAAE